MSVKFLQSSNPPSIQDEDRPRYFPDPGPGCGPLPAVLSAPVRSSGCSSAHLSPGAQGDLPAGAPDHLRHRQEEAVPGCGRHGVRQRQREEVSDLAEASPGHRASETVQVILKSLEIKE